MRPRTWFLSLSFIISSLLWSRCSGRNESSTSRYSGRQLSKKASSSVPAAHYISGTTGILFTGDDTRKYKGTKYYVGAKPEKPEKRHKSHGLFGKPAKDLSKCSRWSVVTTIFEISEGIRRTLQLDDSWCTVVVTDRKTPVESYQGLDRLVLLTVEEQEAIAKKSAFVMSTPWNHFARKNIGFLYAISRGAEYIFDVDDDNELKAKDAASTVRASPLPDVTEKIDMVAVDTLVTSAFNPYPMFHATNPAAWPRGFPLMNVTQKETFQGSRRESAADFGSVAVFQALADHDPDVDAIYRLTQRHLHFSFKDATSNDAVQPLAIPPGVYTPYNAQATVHCQSAYMFMVLPTTVPGRVSDIWRSYFTQRLLWDMGKVVAFTKPTVAQERTAHNYLKDFDAEQDLYYKTNSLIDFLKHWDGSHIPTMEGRMEQLYINLYEHTYIEIGDVRAVQEWLDTLKMANYDFPLPTVNHRRA